MAKSWSKERYNLIRVRERKQEGDIDTYVDRDKEKGNDEQKRNRAMDVRGKTDI